MKLAIMADIHGNHEALRAVLREARTKQVERILVLGDLIGYYYGANEVLRALEEWDVIAVKGNHEHLFERSLSEPAVAAQYHQRYGSALDLAEQTLSPEAVDVLTSLPPRRTVTIDGIVFELCHGSPTDLYKYVYPNADLATVEGCILPDRDFVLLGHTHRPMFVSRSGCVILNPGSIGQARDIGGFASWCFLDTGTRAVSLMRTAYSVAALIEETRRRDPHLPYLWEILVRGNDYAVIPELSVSRS